MSRIYSTMHTARRAWWSTIGQRRGARLAITGGLAAVLAIGAGVWWGLAGAAGDRAGTLDGAAPGAGVPPATAVDGVPGATAEPTAGAQDPSGDDGPPGEPGTGSGTGSGDPGSGGEPGTGTSGGESGTGTSGGGAANRAPVIDDPGLSTDGLTLTVAPQVTDPDGDQVTVGIVVDGQPVGTDAAGTARVTFDPAQGGYTRDASVQVLATDSRGAVAEEVSATTLRAVTRAEVHAVRFEVTNPGDCFADEPARRLTGSLQFYGSVRRTVQISEELRPDRTRIALLDSEAAEIVGKEPVLRVILAGGRLANGTDIVSRVHPADDTGTFGHDLFQHTTCHGVLTYRVTFLTK